MSSARLARLPASYTAWQGLQQTWDVCLVESGAAQWLYRGQRRRTDAGMIRLKEPGERFVTEQVLAPTSYLILQIDAAHFDTLADLRPPARHLRAAQLDGPPAHAAASLLRAATRAETLLARGELVTRLVHHTLLAHLEQPTARAHPSVNPGLRRARDFLHAHVHDEVPLTTLAAIARMHEVSLVRAFRRAFGCPPHQLQIDLRVRTARKLLDAGLTCALVAAHVGFHDQSHLTRHFKRIVGISPGRYAATAARSEAAPEPPYPIDRSSAADALARYASHLRIVSA